jgi:hypothetical protein
MVFSFSREHCLLFDDVFSLEVIRLAKLILLLTRVLRSIGLRGLEN